MMKDWMIATATILFDDSKNDLRALPKTVRLHTDTLSFVCHICYILVEFMQIFYRVSSHSHIAIIAYYTFKQFHNIKVNKYKFGAIIIIEKMIM